MINNFTILLSQVNSIIKVYEKHTALSGERFNVFSIMGMESDEVRTHSSIIGELLNPKGSHSLGEIPLQLFLKQIFGEGSKEQENETTEEKAEDKFEFDSASSICQKELYVGKIDDENTEGGRLDLVISDKSKATIVIENKIYAPDQDNQLGRYRAAYPTAKLIYLTLDGKLSNEKVVKYFTRSYHTDILNWIEACAKEAFDKPMVREVLNQYAFLIRKLTNQTTNVNMKEEIETVIKDNYKASLEIYKNFEDVKKNIIKEVFEAVLERGKSSADGVKWNIKFDCDDPLISKDTTSLALLISINENSENFYYLKYEYSSSKLLLGIVPKEQNKLLKKRSLVRVEAALSRNSDIIAEYLNEKDAYVDKIINEIEAFIKQNYKEH